MKRLSLLGCFGLLASVLAGCPIFSGDAHNNCYELGDCGTWTTGGSGTYQECWSPGDCAENETCGPDGMCHSGDCTFSGCIAGYTCVTDPDTYLASCVLDGGSGGSGGSIPTGGSGGPSTGGSGGSGGTSTGGSGGTATGGTGGAPAVVYCGKPADCASDQLCAPDGTCQAGPCDNATNPCIYGFECTNGGTCVSPTAHACDNDTNCASGYICIAGTDNVGGVCTPPADQCFDQSQCGADEKCVNGKCTLSCISQTDCRDGLACDLTLGICSIVVKTCTITNDCGGPDTVCVAGNCVPRSPDGSCGGGDVWAENGCIPNQGATFTCQLDGQQDVCLEGSICLHHSCYISCDAPNGTACQAQPTLNVCKPVEDGSATYNVCGTDQNLGNECGAGAPVAACSGGKVCIDGFCK